MNHIIEYIKQFNTRDNTSNTKNKFLNEIIKLKKDYQKNIEEKNANKMFVLEEVLSIQNLFLKSFNEIKNKKYYEGWCTLEECEVKIGFILKHITKEEKQNYWINFIKDKIRKIQLLYPYNLFTSTEFIEKEKKCSICDKVVSIRNHCGHDVGHIYNGVPCYRIVTQVDFIGMAIVENPAHKYAVAFFDDGEKKNDFYNYVVVEYLINGLNSPFDEWSVKKSEKLHPHSKFRDVGRNDKCPCASNEKYKNCCLPKDGVLMPHYDFDFSIVKDEKLLGLKFV